MGSNLLFITVASHAGKWFSHFLRSCAAQGMYAEVLGWGRPFEGKSAKLKLIYDRIRLERRYKYLLFLDAFDTVVLENQDAILEKYLSMNTPLLMSAELTCAPDRWKAEMYPRCERTYPFLNSGAFVGEIAYVRKLFEESGAFSSGKTENDQRFLTDYYIKRPESMTLDSDARIFQSMFKADDHVIVDEEGVFNRLTGTRPSVIHFNGSSHPLRVFQHLNLAPADIG